ncbi:MULTISPECIES: class I SAM-dependent methyltransferase [unclassified Anaeromyxobacter]|uniref:class I SAM-dependent methyltransferase n=1 Tax=unclassified Anaeromyxobacter TaxID=2620896 RepID=UPI001F563FFC|nr:MULTISPECIES: class I SAM-dependent methyltransferase [unclassified Anaeromyxobacter]
MRGLEQIPWLYDLGLALLERGRLGRWREWLAGGARGRTLDLGTGTGRNLPLLPRGAAVAVDPHRANLARARSRAPHVPLVLARAEALPFRDGAFDTVLSGLVLCSVRDVPLALGEARRVLAPGGTLRAIEHVRGGHLIGAIQDRVQPAWTVITGGCHPNRETERALREAGFELDASSLRARGVMRRLEAQPRGGSLRSAPPGRHDP